MMQFVKEASKGRVLFWSIATKSVGLETRTGFIGGKLRTSTIPFEKCTEGITTELSRNIDRMMKAGFKQVAQEDLKQVQSSAEAAYLAHQKEMERKKMAEATKVPSPFTWF